MSKVDFKAMKAKVGIDDVAYHLGYRIDKKAGLGRYIEMVLPNSNGDVKDKIIVKNPQDKANQTYFKRDGQKGGDVITFILNNLPALGQSGKNQWEAVVKVLADFSNTYVETSQKYIDNIGYKGAQVFDKSRYDVQHINTDIVGISRLLEVRGINIDTITAFTDSLVRIRDRYNSTHHYYNVGFPYTRPYDNEVVGYEIRGHKGFKSKAAGTNSSDAAWIVDLSPDKNPLTKQYIFFTESAFDAMAFYQANKSKLDLSSVIFVSIGGTFSDNQVRAIMQHYKNATAVDCFDNDIAGKLYGLRMLSIVNDAKFETSRSESAITIKINGIERSYQEKELTPAHIAREFNLKTPVQRWKAPEKFKDWNDVILGKPQMPPRFQKSKYEQQSQLRQTRLKI